MTESHERSGLPVPERDALDSVGHGVTALAAEEAAQYAERWRDGQLRAAAKVIRQHDAMTTGKLPGDAHREVAEYLRNADESADRADRYRTIRDGHTSASVRSEPRVYAPNSPNSYYLDVSRAAMPGIQGHQDAVANLERYSRELTIEAKAGSPEGRRALNIAGARGRNRGEDGVRVEQRGLTTGTSSAGAFTVPIYLESSFGLYNSFPPAFLEQTTKLADPGHGMTMYLPSFASAPTVAQQTTQNSGVSDSTPSATFLTANLATFTGEVEVSQQLFDRVGPLGMDEVIHSALAQQLATQVDTYVITTALATAGTVAGSSLFAGAAGLYGDIAQAKAAMETASGTKIPATHVFSSTSFVEWLEAWVDPNGRPLLLPAYSTSTLPIQPDASGNAPVGFTGERLLGTALFADGNIAPSGSNAQIIVANPAEVFTLQSEPVIRAVPETFAQDLSVTIQLYGLVGAIVRHPLAIQNLTGSAYPAAPTFA